MSMASPKPNAGSLCTLAHGYALRQISLELNISENTAKYHRRNVYQKLGVSSRQELINLASSAQAMQSSESKSAS